MFTSTEIAEIKAAFACLEIAPTVDRDTIKKAYRKAALKWHPDRFATQAEKDQAHAEFVKLAEARDIVFEVLDIPGILDHLSGRAAPEREASRDRAYTATDTHASPHSAQPHYGASRNNTSSGRPGSKQRTTAYEEEWRVFVKDKNAYFNLMNSASATAGVLAQTFLVSLSVSAAMGAMVFLIIVIAATVGLLGVAVFSASLAIPIYGWFAAFYLIRSCGSGISNVAGMIGDVVDSSAERTLKYVSRTGYPTRGFWLSFMCSVMITLLADISLFQTGYNVLGWIALILLFIMGGSLIAVNEKIGVRLRQMDAEFSKIRATTSFALVLAPRVSRAA